MTTTAIDVIQTVAFTLVALLLITGLGRLARRIDDLEQRQRRHEPPNPHFKERP